MGLADQMRPLATKIAADHDQRVAAVTHLRAATARELSQVNAARRKTAKDYRKAADENLETLHRDVDTFRTGCQTEQHTAAARQRKQLDAHMKALRRDVAAFLSDMDETHATLSAEQAERLAAGRSALQEATVAMIEGLTSEREASTEEQRERLAAQRDALGEQTVAMLEELATDRDEMTTAQHQHLAAGRAGLAASVAGVRELLQKDLAAARRLWLSIDSLKGNGHTKPGSAPGKAVAAGPSHSTKAKHDDLTVIRGLGPAMQRRLNEAGVTTFAQLAKSSAGTLRKALGEASGRAKIGDWITEARNLAR